MTSLQGSSWVSFLGGLLDSCEKRNEGVIAQGRLQGNLTIYTKILGAATDLSPIRVYAFASNE